jgi:hypothetical protein
MSNAKVQSTFVQISAASAHDPWARNSYDEGKDRRGWKCVEI